MKLKIFDTLSSKKQQFDPIENNNVRMYVCGPTVYDLAHIGNARPVIVFDVLFRILQKIYGEKHVSYVRNITDIDDKIITAAKQKKISTNKLTENTISFFHEDIKSLNVLEPSFEPKATETISEMILMISDLIRKKFAYEIENHVFFDTNQSKEYGKLSKRTLDDMIVGSRVEISPYKKNPYDFVLWKPSKDGEPGWDSPWGFGRPGWHIECSAMTKKFLGISFDIHAGGADLIFPHHENEIAQSESAHGKLFAKYWMHNGYLNIEGEKMSKSVGNILTIRELLKEYDGEVLRFAMLSSQYRKPINFSKELLESSKKQLNKIYQSFQLRSLKEDQNNIDIIPESLLDDMNTPLAISEIHEIVKNLNNPSIDDQEWIKLKKQLKFYGKLMGLFNYDAKKWFEKNQKKFSNDEIEEIEKLVQERNLARQNNNFKLADKIREDLSQRGVLIKDKDNESVWELINGSK